MKNEIKIKKELNSLLNNVSVLENKNATLLSEENKNDFKYNLERIKIYLNDTKMVIDRDVEYKKMVEAMKK